jgi:hypothetical protein
LCGIHGSADATFAGVKCIVWLSFLVVCPLACLFLAVFLF